MSEKPIFDRDGALDRVEGDTELFFELIQIFDEEYEESIGKIGTAVEGGDAAGLESSAHSIKSALGNIGAMRAFELAYQLELAGRENQLSESAELFSRLQQEIVQFREAVTAFKESC